MVYDPKEMEDDLNYDESIEVIDLDEGDRQSAPVKLELRSTSTTNPTRPRTIAAGYDSASMTMTVVFRPDSQDSDGTWYNYYDVPVEMWEQFKEAPSKGVYLRESGLDNWHSKGTADMDSMNSRARAQYNSIVRASRRKQLMSWGGQSTSNPRSKLWDLTKTSWTIDSEDYR